MAWSRRVVRVASTASANGRKHAIGAKRLTEIASKPDDRRSGALGELQRALAERLVGTRADFHEAVSCYSVRIQGVLAHVADVLNEEGPPLSDDEARDRERTLQRAMDHLESLELKPAKGRRRDLKAVENLAN